MSDTSEPRRDEGFWIRVRGALDGLRPMRPHREPLYGRAEIDRCGGAHDLHLLEEALGKAWAETHRYHAPLSLLLVELDRWSEYVAAYGAVEGQDCLAALGGIIEHHMRPRGERCLSMGHNGFAVVLPGRNKQEAKSYAVRVSEDLRRLNLPHKESHAGVVTVAMGLATTKPDAPYDAALLDAATDTLRLAQRRGMRRMMVIDLKPEQRWAA